jgi:hypothetical protein
LREMVNGLTSPAQVEAVLDEALRTDPAVLSASEGIDAPQESCRAVA